MANAAASGVISIAVGPNGETKGVSVDAAVVPRLLSAPDVRAFKIIQDAGLARYDTAVANDVSSKKLVAKRDAYLVATKGDVATAQKIWAIENPNKPWPA